MIYTVKSSLDTDSLTTKYEYRGNARETTATHSWGHTFFLLDDSNPQEIKIDDGLPFLIESNLIYFPHYFGERKKNCYPQAPATTKIVAKINGYKWLLFFSLIFRSVNERIYNRKCLETGRNGKNVRSTFPPAPRERAIAAE